MNTSILKNDQTDEIDLFINACGDLLENLERVGVLAAQAIARDPQFPDKVHARCPDLTPPFILRMEAVGLGKLHAKFALAECPGVSRLKRLPLAIQERYVENPVSLLVQQTSGSWDTLQVDVRNLTSEQARQVFSSDGVRDESAQRTWIEARRIKDNIPSAHDLPYRIQQKELVVTEPCRFNKRSLLKIIDQL
jgi:hypothetical protein